MANTKLPARLLDTSAIPALNVTGDLTVDTTTLKVDSTNNRVGIGIASPDSQLHVHGVGAVLSSNSYFVAQIQTDRNDDGSNDDGILQFVNGSAKTVKGEIRWDESTNTFELGHGDNQGHLVIASGGNVGIGNSSPSSLSWPNGSTGGLFLQAGGLLSAYNAGTNLSQNWYYNAGEKFIANGGASRYVQSGQQHSFSRSTTVNASGAGAGLTWSESLRIDASGNVGIGTTSPNQNGGTGTFTWASPLQTIAGSRPTLFLNGSSVITTLRMWPRATDGTSTSVDDWHINAINEGSGGYISFAPQGGAIAPKGLYLKNNGNVGIGTTSPGWQFVVQGAGTGSGLQDGHVMIRSTTAANPAGLMFINSGNTASYNDLGSIQGIVESGNAKGALRFITRNSDGNNTGVAERMRISSGGIVTKPYQPAFRATGNGSWQGLLGNVQAPFNVAPVNIGGHYSTSNKRFTAPVAGQYYFTWHTYNDNNYSNAIVPRLNGTAITGGGGDGIVTFNASTVAGNLTISASIILTLAASDYVDIACRSNHSSRIYMGHSQFSGYLIG